MNWYKTIKLAMPKIMNWTQEQFDEMGELIRAGFTYEQIGKRFNVTGKTIYNLNVEHKWRPVRTKTYLTEDQGNQIKKLHLVDGLNTIEIAERTGIKANSIRHFLDSKKISVKRTWRPTEEEKNQIVEWYTVPPEGEGKSIRWITEQFPDKPNSRSIIWKVIEERGIPIRSKTEQSLQESSKQRRSEAAVDKWIREGGLNGRIALAPNRYRATRILNGFIGNALSFKDDNANRSKGKGITVLRKYENIIANNIYPEDLISAGSREEATRKLNEYNSRLRAEGFIRADELFEKLQQVINNATYSEDGGMPPSVETPPVDPNMPIEPNRQEDFNKENLGESK